MTRRPPDEQQRHDAVVEASAARWGDVSDRGLVVSTNPGDEENQHAGAVWNPRYPDVLLWQPEEPGADHGTSVIIEEVETRSTVDEEEVDQWRDYAQLYTHRFNLIVPKASAEDAAELVEAHDIPISEVITYVLEGDRLHFERFRTFVEP